MRIFRAAYTTTPPDGATWSKATKGKARVATWKGRGGKNRKGTETSPGSGKVTVEVADHWYYEILDENGNWDQRKGLADKGLTEQLARRKQVDADAIRSGLVPATVARAAARTLSEHVDDYLADLFARGNVQQYLDATEAHLREALKHLKASTVADLTPAQARGWVDDVRRVGRDGKALPKGTAFRLGAAACNHRLRSLKSFCEWMVGEGRADRNPLHRIEYFDADADIRHARRSFTEDEYQRILVAGRNSRFLRTYADHSPVGEDREMIYLIAGYTGFRCSEIASMTPASFDLAGTPPAVVVQAGYSKRRREDRIPLPLWLAKKLESYLAGRPAHERIWPGRWHRKAAELLYRDLETAKIEKVDGRGRFADFHSLRRTFISRLIRGGCNPKIAQQLARHSTITLTLDVYADAEIDEMATAQNALPAPPSPT